MKKVGNFLIDLDKPLGQGQYGKVYLAQEIPQNSELMRQQTVDSKQGDANQKNYQLFDQQQLEQLNNPDNQHFFACKVVERKNLCHTKEQLIVSEIQNQDSVMSNYVVRLKKAIKTDARYYIFMEYCNGSDLKDVMELRNYKISPSTVQKIMNQLVNGFNDMMDVLVIHRDLKLQNIMLHFPNYDKHFFAMSSSSKK